MNKSFFTLRDPVFFFTEPGRFNKPETRKVSENKLSLSLYLTLTLSLPLSHSHSLSRFLSLSLPLTLSLMANLMFKSLSKTSLKHFPRRQRKLKIFPKQRRELEVRNKFEISSKRRREWAGPRSESSAVGPPRAGSWLGTSSWTSDACRRVAREAMFPSFRPEKNPIKLFIKGVLLDLEKDNATIKLDLFVNLFFDYQNYQLICYYIPNY